MQTCLALSRGGGAALSSCDVRPCRISGPVERSAIFGAGRSKNSPPYLQYSIFDPEDRRNPPSSFFDPEDRRTPPPSSIFGAEDRVEDRHRSRGETTVPEVGHGGFCEATSQEGRVTLGERQLQEMLDAAVARGAERALERSARMGSLSERLLQEMLTSAVALASERALEHSAREAERLGRTVERRVARLEDLAKRQLDRTARIEKTVGESARLLHRLLPAAPATVCAFSGAAFLGQAARCRRVPEVFGLRCFSRSLRQRVEVAAEAHWWGQAWAPHLRDLSGRPRPAGFLFAAMPALSAWAEWAPLPRIPTPESERAKDALGFEPRHPEETIELSSRETCLPGHLASAFAAASLGNAAWTCSPGTSAAILALVRSLPSAAQWTCCKQASKGADAYLAYERRTTYEVQVSVQSSHGCLDLRLEVDTSIGYDAVCHEQLLNNSRMGCSAQVLKWGLPHSLCRSPPGTLLNTAIGGFLYSFQREDVFKFQSNHESFGHMDEGEGEGIYDLTFKKEQLALISTMLIGSPAPDHVTMHIIWRTLCAPLCLYGAGCELGHTPHWSTPMCLYGAGRTPIR